MSKTKDNLLPISHSVYELIIQILKKNKITLLSFQKLWSDQVTILHKPRQLSCRGMRIIVTWQEL